MYKYLLLLLIFFITGCVNKQEVENKSTNTTSIVTEKKQEKIVDTFSKKLKLNFVKRENKESLFSLGYGHFKKD